MTTAAWNLTFEDIHHSIELAFTFLSGARVLSVDGNVVAREYKPLKLWSEHELRLGGTLVCITTRPESLKDRRLIVELHHCGRVITPMTMSL